MIEFLGILIEYPWLALLPAGVFTWAALKSGRRLVWTTALLWALYAAYEMGMKLRILCSGECNIRIDLLLIYPALVLLSIVAVILAFRPKTAR
jgi:hypothetical protein